MDRPAGAFVPTKFRSPPRIIIPRLEKSRDQWKAKTAAANAKLHQRGIRIRDLDLSRDYWKAIALAAKQNLSEAEEQLRDTREGLADALARVARLEEDAKKSNHPLYCVRPF